MIHMLLKNDDRLWFGAHILHRLNIILYLVLNIGVVSYNISFDIMRWGLRPCMDMETDENEMIANYGDVGLWLI